MASAHTDKVKVHAFRLRSKYSNQLCWILKLYYYQRNAILEIVMNLILNMVKARCYINSLHLQWFVSGSCMRTETIIARCNMHRGLRTVTNKKKSLQNNDTRVHGWKRSGVCSRVTGGALHTRGSTPNNM